jgi:hypothetical protein
MTFFFEYSHSNADTLWFPILFVNSSNEHKNIFLRCSLENEEFSVH